VFFLSTSNWANWKEWLITIFVNRVYWELQISNLVKTWYKVDDCLFFIFKLFFTSRTAQSATVPILFLLKGMIFQFFTQQRWHVTPIKVNFGWRPAKLHLLSSTKSCLSEEMWIKFLHIIMLQIRVTRWFFPVQMFDKVKDLGVWFDSKLSFKLYAIKHRVDRLD